MMVTDQNDDEHITVMVVDDDGTTRLFAHQFLDNVGSKVLEAADWCRAWLADR